MVVAGIVVLVAVGAGPLTPLPPVSTRASAIPPANTTTSTPIATLTARCASAPRRKRSAACVHVRQHVFVGLERRRVVEVGRLHDSSSSIVSTARSGRVRRDAFDFTVPIERPSNSATSASDRSARWRNTITSRWRRGSAVQRAVQIEPCGIGIEHRGRRGRCRAGAPAARVASDRWRGCCSRERPTATGFPKRESLVQSAHARAQASCAQSAASSREPEQPERDPVRRPEQLREHVVELGVEHARGPGLDHGFAQIASFRNAHHLFHVGRGRKVPSRAASLDHEHQAVVDRRHGDVDESRTLELSLELGPRPRSGGPSC